MASTDQVTAALAEVRLGLKAEAAIYQAADKRHVARLSGIDFATLAHMPFAEWMAERRLWIGG